MLKTIDNDGGSGGSKASGEIGVVRHVTSGSEEGVGGEERGKGPLRTDFASLIIEWSRRSWEEIKGAELRSPVQRVMSTQSRDSLKRVRRVVREFRMRGWVGDR